MLSRRNCHHRFRPSKERRVGRSTMGADNEWGLDPYFPALSSFASTAPLAQVYHNPTWQGDMASPSQIVSKDSELERRTWGIS